MCQLRIQHLAIRVAALAIAASVLWATPFAAAAVRTIALKGGNPFATGEDATFSAFTAPSLNNRGQVAYAAQLTGLDVSAGNDTGYWIADGDTFQMVIREGTAAPGMPAGTLFGNAPSLFNGYVPLNDAGEIAIGHGVTLPNSSTSSGLWIGNGGSLSLLATQGSAAPGAQNDAPFLGLANVRASINRRGDVAFNANLNATPYTTINSNNYSDGLWILNRSGLVATALAGDSAAPLGEGALIVGFSTFTHPSLNRHATAAFNAAHRPAGSTAYLSSSWVTSASGLASLGASGQPLPEVGANAVMSSLSHPGINSAGTTVVQGHFSNSGGSPPSGSFIMVSNSAGFSLPAFSGGSAPGLPGYTFSSTSYDASLGSGGHIAFFGSVTNGTTNKSGVWTGQPDSLQPVAIQGEAAPGANATFSYVIRDTPAVNRYGQIAFPVYLIDSQSGASSNSVWATGLDGNLTLIARTGTTMEVAAGDARTISSLAMLFKHGDDDGRPRGMNDLGQIAFRANFTDGSSGIFLSEAVAHLPGDYNGDGTVDAGDYIVWRKAVATQNLIADGDRDGVVGAADHELMREFFGISLTQSAGGWQQGAVPEPSTSLILAMLSAPLMRRRRGVTSRPSFGKARSPQPSPSGRGG